MEKAEGKTAVVTEVCKALVAVMKVWVSPEACTVETMEVAAEEVVEL